MQCPVRKKMGPYQEMRIDEPIEIVRGLKAGRSEDRDRKGLDADASPRIDPRALSSAEDERRCALRILILAIPLLSETGLTWSRYRERRHRGRGRMGLRHARGEDGTDEMSLGELESEVTPNGHHRTSTGPEQHAQTGLEAHRDLPSHSRCLH